MKLINFFPHGLLRESDKLLKWVDGVQVEFNLIISKFTHYMTNFNPWTSDDTEFVDRRLDELGDHLANLDTFTDKKDFVVYKWQESGDSTLAGIESALLAHGYVVTLTEFSIPAFKGNLGRVNQPLYQDSSRHLFEVAYVGTHLDQVKLLISRYKPANSHPIYI